MGFDWKEKSESEGPDQADKLPPGKHSVTVSKIVYSKRGGDPFQSRDGDPQIMLIFTDREAREAAQMVTLSDKAGWVLAKIMGCFDPPANLARMEADGVEPKHFANPEFADKQIVGRKLTVEVTYEKGRDGKEYSNVIPLKPDPSSTLAPPATTEAPPPPVTDDAPPTVGMTKEEAWAAVVEAWKTAPGPDASKKRNESWKGAVLAIGKPEKDFTPENWAVVKDNASIPF